MSDLYLEASFKQAETITNAYSTSFSSSLRLVDRRLRPAVYAVYAMVRLADEIVDSPGSDVDIRAELGDFKSQLDAAIAKRYSSNPTLHAFQYVYYRYGLKMSWVDAFFASMRMDLLPVHFSEEEYEQYIYGSAQAVGLMCLPIFCDGHPGLAQTLEEGAGKLGSGYQKINFLRDVAADYSEKGRSYFPGTTPGSLTVKQKQVIEADIANDFQQANTALRKLPKQARRGVRLSYLYFDRLLKEISAHSPEQLFEGRVSVPRSTKMWLFVKAAISL